MPGVAATHGAGQRAWHNDLSRDVLDSAETPAGCWTHYSVIETRLIVCTDGGEVHEFKSLRAGDAVDLDGEHPGQDGFAYRGVTVRKRF